MKTDKRKYKITGITPILGSVCSDKDLYTAYIASKAKTDDEAAKAAEDAALVDGEERTSGFYKDEETGAPVLAAYQFKGFLKAAAKTLAKQVGLNATTSKIDNLVFITERYIPFKRLDGTVITEPDGFLERPLRAETPQGPRVGLAKSEVIKEWTLEFTILVVENEKTAKSAALTLDLLEELMDYGELKGLLQWRNSGHGSFKWERVE